MFQIDKCGGKQREPERERTSEPEQSNPDTGVAGQRLDLNSEDRERVQPRKRLDDRVARRDLGLTATRAAEQNQVREHRQIVEGTDRLAATWAVRTGPCDALAARHPVDDDIEKTTEQKSERYRHCGKEDGRKIGQAGHA